MLRVLMISDVFFPRVNGVSTSIATFRRALAEQGVEVRLIAPRYADEAEEAGIVRIAGRRLPLDPEDRLADARAMHAAASFWQSSNQPNNLSVSATSKFHADISFSFSRNISP